MFVLKMLAPACEIPSHYKSPEFRCKIPSVISTKYAVNMIIYNKHYIFIPSQMTYIFIFMPK